MAPLFKDTSSLEAAFIELEVEAAFSKGHKAGREKGLDEGVRQGLREAVTDILAVRLGPVPEDLEARLANVRAREDLKYLVAAAACAADLAAFRRQLDALSANRG